MKRSTKRDIAISCFVFALGCFLMAAGWGMGGRFSGGQTISIGGSNGVQVGGNGIFIGGSNGVYVGPYGISIGGRNGIYIGPAGIRIGASEAYNEAETTVIDQVYIRPGNAIEWNDTVYEEDDDVIVQDIEVGAFDSVEANVDLGDIVVMQDGPGYFVEFRNNIDGYELNYKFDGSTLVIWSEGQSKPHWGETTNARATVTILIPSGATLKNLELYSNLGDILVGTLDHGTAKATLDTDLGDVTWYGGQVKELYANSALGDVTVLLSGMEKVGYELSTSLGEVMVNDLVMGKDKASYAPRDMECYVQANSDLGNVYLGTEE
ncbi:MAG: DUF4097 family beta strand repeat-containing protein [Oscillospiraceae bacterium]|nr:DUF4097 family beta strand repeat-containing protein [Oscillospiraceae bacterium]